MSPMHAGGGSKKSQQWRWKYVQICWMLRWMDQLKTTMSHFHVFLRSDTFAGTWSAPPGVFKYICPVFHQDYYKSLQTECVSNLWKEAVVVPFPESGKRLNDFMPAAPTSAGIKVCQSVSWTCTRPFAVCTSSSQGSRGCSWNWASPACQTSWW